MFFLFWNSLQNSQNILFSFPSNLRICICPFMSPGTSVFFLFLARAGVSDAMLISLSSHDCFPPKKEYSEPYTCFHFNILWLTF